MTQHHPSKPGLQGKKISEPATERSGSEIFFTQNRPPKIALVASIAWTLWNYRRSLISALEAQDCEILLLAADDPSRTKLETHTSARFFPLRQLSRRSLSPLQNLRCLWEIFSLLRRLQPDVVLHFTIRPNTLGNLAAAAAGIPSISTVEGMGIANTMRPWLRALTKMLYRLAFRHARKVVFLNNDDLQEFLRQQIIRPEKALLVPGPGVSLQHFAPQPKARHAAPFVFLFVARLLSEKGIREFVAAAKVLKNKGTPAEFWVLGSIDDGNPATLSTSELENWAREGAVQHLGFLDDVRPVIAQADAVVLPSYYREGVPRSVLEAMSMQKPIITTDNVGCRDTVEDGRNGYLVPPRNVSALVLAMEKMLALAPAEREAMGLYSRQKVEAAFGDDQVLPQYLSLIRTVLQGQ